MGVNERGLNVLTYILSDDILAVLHQNTKNDGIVVEKTAAYAALMLHAVQTSWKIDDLIHVLTLYHCNECALHYMFCYVCILTVDATECN